MLQSRLKIKASEILSDAKKKNKSKALSWW